ncbi:MULTISPECIES: hypothetical protein [Leptolyngbya]|uniref:hypothetical protein n=1 Tax=Leptolyngbya TaxID=47251 RepID=UPI001684D96E|nr:hypothetical protein [Leptolyngbya sp. FACHB-1624]MBD1856455.1 hypothetical protein [Leptolyngbya sp. FACHB-1624]
MKFDEVLRSLETTEFAAQANLASGYKTFIRFAYEHEAVTELLRKLSKSSRQRHLVLARIRHLAKKDFDLNYRNPWDVALATYMQTLSLVDLDLAQEGAAIVAKIPNCWWSNKTAQHFLTYSSFKEIKSNTSVSKYELRQEFFYSNSRPQATVQVTQEIRRSQNSQITGQSVKSYAVASTASTVSSTVRGSLNFSVTASKGSSEVFVTA